MKKRMYLVAGAMFLFNLFSVHLSSAEDFDFLQYAKDILLPCAHPTTELTKAQAAFITAPTEEEQRISAQVQITYKGWLKENEMQVTIVLRQCCDESWLIRVEVLSDSSGTGTMVCKYTSGGWFDIEFSSGSDPGDDKLDSGKYIKSPTK